MGCGAELSISLSDDCDGCSCPCCCRGAFAPAPAEAEAAPWVRWKVDSSMVAIVCERISEEESKLTWGDRLIDLTSFLEERRGDIFVSNAQQNLGNLDDGLRSRLTCFDLRPRSSSEPLPATPPPPTTTAATAAGAAAPLLGACCSGQRDK